ncbi:MAG: hypothetical protein ABF990_11460 [Acetobacter sp.]|uniref:hypothetical protein n=1 Tax=Acetobacter sp. TaxID=440 RepID=UPI0039E8A4EB
MLPPGAELVGKRHDGVIGVAFFASTGRGTSYAAELPDDTPILPAACQSLPLCPLSGLFRA